MVLDLRETEVPMIVCDPAGRVVEASLAGARVLKAIGVEIKDPSTIPESLRAVLSGAEPGQSYEWTQEPSGDLALGLTRYQHGENFLVLMRELSGVRRSLVRRLRDQRNEIVAQMSSAIAHEFRNVLATIVYNIDCVLDAEAKTPLSPLQGECIRDVSEAAKRLGGIIQVMLEYARGDVSSKRSQSAPQLLDQVSSFVRAGLRQRGHDLETRADAGLPPIHGNPLAIEQIAISMIACASAFSNRPMHLVLSAQQELVDGKPSIAIRLRDDGPGLPVLARARIFDPLLEGPSGESGVGLALAREAAASIDGKLSVEPSSAGNAFVAHLRAADVTEARR